jgi:hypothetical protein
VGQKLLTSELIKSMLVRDVDDLESRFTRHGYHVQALADLLNVRRVDIRAFLAG